MTYFLSYRTHNRSPEYIRANDYVSDNLKNNSNESILEKKLAECDFHVHARTRRICVYFFFETIQSDFIDFYVKKKKTLKKKNFFIFSFLYFYA